jgi:LPS export ABC transporter protein LptC
MGGALPWQGDGWSHFSSLHIAAACGINYAYGGRIFGRHNNFQAMLRKFLRIFLTFALLLVLGAALYGSYRFLRSADFSVPAMFRPDPGKRLLISMDGFRFAQSENGRVPWRVNAARTELFESKEARLKEVEISFLEQDGRKTVLLGESGTMDTLSGNATIRRGLREVRIITSDGYLMTTNTLSWKASAREIRTTDPFKVLGKEIYLEGKGFSADVDMRKMLVNGNVKAVLQE